MSDEGLGQESFEEIEQPAVSEPEKPIEQPTPTAAEEVIDQPEEPRRLRRFLIWTVGLLVLFALGVVAAWFLQIQPMRVQNRTLLEDLTSAQEQVGTLTSEVERLRPLESENKALQERVTQLESHIFLLDVLVDVSKAQLAMAEEDPIAAKDALDGTRVRLNQLESRLSGEHAETVDGMSERLVLVVDEVETDAFAARRDLEVLANNLIALEQRLFGE